MEANTPSSLGTFVVFAHCQNAKEYMLLLWNLDRLRELTEKPSFPFMGYHSEEKETCGRKGLQGLMLTSAPVQCC